MQAPSRVKLQPDQTENLPFPVGCEVWYNFGTGNDDIGVKSDESRLKTESGCGIMEHGDLMVKKWGSLLGGNASDDVDAKNKVNERQNSICYSQRFRSGFVSAVYLDLMTSSIRYEVTPIKQNEKMPPEARLFSDNELKYSHGSSINLSPVKERLGTDTAVPGVVMLCRPKRKFIKRQPVTKQASAQKQTSDANKVETTNLVLEIKAALAHENARILRFHKPPTDSQHISTITNLLKRLRSISIDAITLTCTKIGGSVSKLKSYDNGEVARLASSLLDQWRTLSGPDDSLNKVLSIKHTLVKPSEGTLIDLHADEIIDALCSLNNIHVDISILQETKIGIVASKLKKSKNATISMMAKSLVKKWKDIASTTSQPTGSASNDGEEHAEIEPTFVYSIKVLHDDGSFHVEDDVSIDRVKHRHVASADKPNASDKLEFPTIAKPEKTEAADKTMSESHFDEELAALSNTNIDIREAVIDRVSYPLASPSTLTTSDTTRDQAHSSSSNPQQGSSKRKSLSSEKGESLDQPSKRFLSETSHVPPKSKCLYGEEMASVGSEKVHRFAETNTSTSCVKIPLRVEHVPRILGTKGLKIKDIQSKTGCIIDIRGNGAYKGTTNEPLHAKVTGNNPSALEAAAAMVRSIIRDSEMESPERSVARMDQKSAYYNREEVNRRSESDANLCEHNFNNLYCRLNFPPWLVYDSFTKDRLHYFLSSKTGKIGQMTNCRIKIRDAKETGVILPFYDPTHLYIESNKDVSAHDAKKNLLRAKEEVENVLLDFIGGDNSKGRLFYDIAISCSFFHGQIDDRTTTVFQRNPFTCSNKRVWINVIELPYCRRRDTNRKDYQYKFLVTANAGILREVHQRTGCILKICGEKINVPVKYCDPYVIVSGNEHHLVDMAVKIVTDAIKDYLRINDDLRWKEHSEQRLYSLRLQNKRH